MSLYEHEGIAKRSRFRGDPPLRILVEAGSDWVTWCTGAPALKENTPSRRRCPACWTLLRELKAEVEADGDTFQHSWETSTSRRGFLR